MSAQTRWVFEAPRAHDDGDVTVMSAVVRAVGTTGPIEHDLELRVHDAGPIDTSAAPMLPLACAVAVWANARVRVDGEVAPSVAAATGALLDELGARFGATEARVDVAVGLSEQIATDPPSPRPSPSGGAPHQLPTVGLFYTRGVDSASSLIALGSHVTALLGLDWVDRPYADDGQAQIWRGTERAAHERGLPLIRLSSNARQLLDPIRSWAHTHALVLMSLAQLVSPRFDEVVLSGAHRHDLAPRAFGNAPDVVNAWRTETLAMRSFDAADGRTAKTAIVGADDHARRHLLVCWEQPGDRNCGRCLKCVQSMSHALAAGVLDQVLPRFEHPLTVSAVEALAISSRDAETLAVLRELVDDLDDHPLGRAWQQFIAASDNAVRQETP